MAVTGGMYFEDYAVGDVYEHSRGRTVTHFDNYAVTHQSLNTAHAHFDLEYSKQALGVPLPERIVAGPCTIALVVGLTSQDMSENAFTDLGMTALKLPASVFDGDTLRARSEVLELSDDPQRSDTGIMRYRFTGTNQHGKVVAEGERIVRIKRRSAWAQRDTQATFAAPAGPQGASR